MAALIFAIQPVLIFLLVERPRKDAWSDTRQHAVHLLQQGGKGLSTATSELEADPTFYALPDSRSFSGQAWLIPPDVKFEVPVSKAPPRWLDPPAIWGNDFAQFLRTNQPLAAEKLEMPSPPLTKVHLEDNRLSGMTRMTIAGDLASRRIVSRPELPSLTAESLLPDVQVEILVNADGNVVTALIADGNGGVTRDEQAEIQRARAEALALARRISFAPASSVGNESGPFEKLQSGRVVFQWHTVPAPLATP